MQPGNPARPVRVLIVDDTRTIRAILRARLTHDPRVEVVGEAGDPFEARRLIKALDPDVITLDVEMPRMDGLEFLEKLMRLRPMPVVMVSTRTSEQSDEAVRALALGAVDCIDIRCLRAADATLFNLADTLVMAAGARISGPSGRRTARDTTAFHWNGKFILIGSSTGGVDALLTVFAGFPDNCPPTLVAQHMPAPFLASFARRLDRHVNPAVGLARDGDPLEAGRIYLAPGGETHLAVAGRTVPHVRILDSDGSETHTPSVDVLMRSAVQLADLAVAAIMTGMGRDGAAGLLALRNAGAHTIAQSGASAVVDGMPRAARASGAAEEVVDLADIARRLLAATSRVRVPG